MNNDELIQKLEEFQDYLDVGNIFVDPFRWLGGVFLKGLALILDGLERVTDDVLLIKKFFQNPEIVAFVDSIRPLLYILLAFSLLYVGYLLIFQKKFDREGIAINLFIALAVVALLGTGMERANDFTDEAIEAIGNQQLYGEEEGTISQNILSRNIYDLTEFDKNGWSSTELSQPNTIPLSMISKINFREKFDSGRSELSMSSAGKDLSKNQLIWVGDSKDTTKFDQSGLEWNNEYYYRYSVDWVTILTTLIVMAFTLFSIAYKLARLAFEMTFNYVLATIVAPVDIHDGQKTKKILQSILNTFIVIILIFLSMKVYMIGTSYIADQLSGLAYLIALIAFSLAVIDGPNIVERLFGIDAGLKSGWGVLAGAYAGARMISGTAKSLNGMRNNKNGKGGTESNNINTGNKGNKNNSEKPLSPNDKENDNSTNNGQKPVQSNQAQKAKDQVAVTSENEQGKDGDISGGSSGSSGSIAQLAEEKQDKRRNQTKAPSPNDIEDNNIGGNVPTPTSGVTSPTGTNNAQTTSSSATETSKVSDNATVRQDSDVTGVQDVVQGSMTGSTANTGGHVPTSTSGVTSPTGTNNAQTTSSSGATETTRVTDNATVRQDTEIANNVQEVAGNTTTTSTRTGGSQSTGGTPTTPASGSGATRNTSGSHTTEKTNVSTNSTVTTDTEYSNNVQEVRGNTTTSTTRSGSSSGGHRPHVHERKRPKNYSMNTNDSIVEKMKRHKRR